MTKLKVKVAKQRELTIAGFKVKTNPYGTDTGFMHNGLELKGVNIQISSYIWCFLETYVAFSQRVNFGSKELRNHAIEFFSKELPLFAKNIGKDKTAELLEMFANTTPARYMRPIGATKSNDYVLVELSNERYFDIEQGA